MLFKDHIEECESKISYRVFYPEEKGDYGLLVFLHGAGERGKNIENVMRHAIPRLIREGAEIPAVVLCPQCPGSFVWDNLVSELMSVIIKVRDEFGISEDRVCLTGASMGGFGTIMMGMTYPTFFSAIGPVAGGGMSWRGAKLQTTPAYFIHGDADETVPVIYSKMVSDVVAGTGGQVIFKSLPGLGHMDGIDYAYRNTDLIPWLLEKRRTDRTHVKEICEDMF